MPSADSVGAVIGPHQRFAFRNALAFRAEARKESGKPLNADSVKDRGPFRLNSQICGFLLHADILP